MEENFIVELIRNFYLMSGALEETFDVNEFNIEFIDNVIDEQCKMEIILNL